MGEAKRRGSYEERKAQAIARRDREATEKRDASLVNALAVALEAAYDGSEVER